MFYEDNISLHEKRWTTRRWEKYGLSTKTPAPIDTFKEHNLVCDFLERHPEIEEKYLRKEDGFRVLDILSLAQKELGDGVI